MPDHAAELALLGCVLLNAAVFGTAFRFAARRLTASRSQALLDAALIGYAVQYAAVCGPGAVGLLRPAVMVGVAVAASLAMWIAAGRRPAPPVRRDRWAVVALGLFAAAVVVGWSVVQADLPVMSNDALTYHFPAAVQWLQRGRIELFPTWFFNPANTYSPLAGSAFIAWLMVPFGSDVLARYVQVPALLCVGLAAYRLTRQVSAAPVAAAAVAAAAVLCRPLLLASQMGKDDLFVTFAFTAALVALARDRSAERFGPTRLGLAFGLLLATKYTALLAVPMLLLAIDGPAWRPRQWLTAGAIAAGFAGPWYVRNWVATGNPVFPLAVPHLFPGLFTTAGSGAFRSPAADVHVVLGGSYGVPVLVAGVIAVGWLGTAVARGRRSVTDPLVRACLIGPAVGIAAFFWRSPFPEPRFLFPALILLVPTVAVAAGRVPWAALALPAATVATLSVSGGWRALGTVVAAAAAVAAVGAAADRATQAGPRRRRTAVVAAAAAAVAAVVYVRWAAYCEGYAGLWSADVNGWSLVYPAEQPLWAAVNRSVPADATVAYADLSLVYPLQGPTLRRRVVYAPARRGVATPADLPYLGDHLSGERVVAAATAATVADPDPAAWRSNLARSAAAYLVVGHAAAGIDPVERRWADADPAHFRPLYAGPAGRVYALTGLTPPAPPPPRKPGEPSPGPGR